MRWMVLVLLLCLAAPVQAIYHGGADDTGGDPAGDAGDDRGAPAPGGQGDTPADPPGWESAPETVGAQRDEGDGEIDSRGVILLVGAVLVVAVLAAALFFASRRP